MKTISYRTESIEKARTTIPELPVGYEWLPVGPNQTNPWYSTGDGGFGADAIAEKDKPEFEDSRRVTI